MKTNNLLILAVLLVIMSIGVIVELKNLYELPTELINSTNTENNATLSRNGFVTFCDYSELEEYLAENSPESWYSPIRFGVLTTVATAAEKGAVTLDTGYSSSGEAPEYYSTTNVQVIGVDEADIVKSDGNYLYLISGDKISIIRVYPLDNAELVSQIKVGEKEYPMGLFINNNTLIIITVKHMPLYHTMETSAEETKIFPPIIPRETTVIYLYDVSDRGKPVLRETHNISGHYITSRMINNTVIIVTQDPIYGIYRETNNAVIVPLLDGEVLPPTKIYYVPNTPPSSYANILTLNIENNTVNATSILMPPVAWVYASLDNIYLFAQEWRWSDFATMDKLLAITIKYMDNETREVIDKIMSTDTLSEALKEQLVYQIISEKINQLSQEDYRELMKEIQEAAVSYIGNYTGPITHVYRIKLQPLGEPEAYTSFDGRILDQFAIDERKGQLRVAVTATIITGIDTYDFFPFVYPITKTVNNVYILNSTSLSIIGELTGLAPGENVYSARYMDDILYLVTFRKVDPLYAIDLSDPENPVVLGYAKMPGYSEYLHPINNTILVGIGYETDEEGRIIGVKVSLYDTSDPLNMKEKSKLVLSTYGYSQVMYDHRAFLYNPYENYIGFPLHYWDYKNNTSVDNAEIIKIDGGKLIKWLEIPHENIQRILYVEKEIITVSPDLVKITTEENNTITIPLSK